MSSIQRNTRTRRARLEQGWSAFLGGSPPEGVPDDILASWERSASAVPPLIEHAPHDDTAPAKWWDGPVAAVFPAVADELRQAALDGDMVAAVTDERGVIVWTAGGRTMRRRAERVDFAAGGLWDEASVGTNALALALHCGRASAVWSAEHFATMVHDWVCYSAPILDPERGSVLGVLDLSTVWTRATPLGLPTVSALARVISAALVRGPVTLAAVRRPVLTLRTLGQAAVAVDGRPALLSPRQQELLAVLSLSPRGLTLEELHERVHGGRPVSPSTTKAELSYLRRSVGPVLLSRPYRLDADVDADHLAVLEAVADGRLDDVLDLYRGAMLPRSDAPAVEEHRHLVDATVRAAVLADGDPGRLFRLSALLPDDAYVHEQALAHLPANDPRRSLVAARLSGV